MTGPLQGFRIVELAAIGPAPFCGAWLADLGADVVRIDRPDAAPTDPRDIVARGRRTVFQVLREYDDVALLPALKAWGAGKKRLEKRDKDALEETVTFLERDRATSARV